MSVYTEPRSKEFLYELLLQREPNENISHKDAPSLEEHSHFIDSRPYKAWYLIKANGLFCGMIYLSKQNEIGIFLLIKYQKKGIGQQTVKMLMDRHSDVKRFLANINPSNQRSIDFFKKFKFRHIQNTYEYSR